MNKFEYSVPKTLENCLQDLKTENAILKAGGVDVLDLMKEGISNPKRLVNIGKLKELRYIKDSDEGLSIGANTTLREMEDSASLLKTHTAIAQAAASIATPQIRNMATLAGNLCQRPRCWYFRNKDFPCARKGGNMCYAIFGENQFHAIMGNQHGCSIVNPSGMATALLAFDASLRIVSDKKSRELPLADFFVSPEQDIQKENVLENSEIITEITIAPKPDGFVSYYYKQKQKQSFDWPIADVAVSFVLHNQTVTGARIILGSAAPVPIRAYAAEEVINGQKITNALAEKAALEAMQDATPMSQNGYKVAVFQAVIKRTILWTAGMDPFA